MILKNNNINIHPFPYLHLLENIVQPSILSLEVASQAKKKKINKLPSSYTKIPATILFYILKISHAEGQVTVENYFPSLSHLFHNENNVDTVSFLLIMESPHISFIVS